MSDGGEGLWDDYPHSSGAELGPVVLKLHERQDDWEIFINGRRLPECYDNREAAKRAAERAAWSVLAGALGKLRVPDEAVKALLNAKDEDGTNVQYALLRGLSVIGYAQPTSATWDLARAALAAALKGDA